jgi:hypothetical protein
MNIIELQENFDQACLLYASKHSPVASLEKLCVVDYIKNKNEKAGTPNYYKVITEWNHPSAKPKDSDLMKFSVDEVKSHYAQVLGSLEDFEHYPVAFNSKTKKLEMLVKNIWQEVPTNSH